MSKIGKALFCGVALAGAIIASSAEAGVLSRLFCIRPSGSSSTTQQSNAASESGRRYSYEPGETPTRSTTSTGVPRGQNHLLPKTDPRRYIPN